MPKRDEKLEAQQEKVVTILRKALQNASNDLFDNTIPEGYNTKTYSALWYLYITNALEELNLGIPRNKR